jgi:hypothetical protein
LPGIDAGPASPAAELTPSCSPSWRIPRARTHVYAGSGGCALKSTLKQYRYSSAVTELTEFSDRGHSLTIDSGWRAVAEECLGCLANQGL